MRFWGGHPVTAAEAQGLIREIRELMSGPCRSASEGVLAGDAYPGESAQAKL